MKNSFFCAALLLFSGTVIISSDQSVKQTESVEETDFQKRVFSRFKNSFHNQALSAYLISGLFVATTGIIMFSSAGTRHENSLHFGEFAKVLSEIQEEQKRQAGLIGNDICSDQSPYFEKILDQNVFHFNKLTKQLSKVQGEQKRQAGLIDVILNQSQGKEEVFNAMLHYLKRDSNTFTDIEFALGDINAEQIKHTNELRRMTSTLGNIYTEQLEFEKHLKGNNTCSLDPVFMNGTLVCDCS